MSIKLETLSELIKPHVDTNSNYFQAFQEVGDFYSPDKVLDHLISFAYMTHDANFLLRFFWDVIKYYKSGETHNLRQHFTYIFDEPLERIKEIESTLIYCTGDGGLHDAEGVTLMFRLQRMYLKYWLLNNSKMRNENEWKENFGTLKN